MFTSRWFGRMMVVGRKNLDSCLTNYEHMLIINADGGIPNGKAEKL
jgi:hypothetical protein